MAVVAVAVGAVDTDGPEPPARPAPRDRRTRARLLAVGAACSGVVAVAVATLLLTSDGGGDAGSGSPALVGTVAATTTLPSTSTTTATTLSTTPLPSPSTTSVATTVALSQPENPPEDERADVPVVEIGSVEVPRIGLSAPLYEGIWLTVLDVGPGHWPGSAGPGGYGNAVVAGHRVSHSAPFRRIDELVPGDTIVLADATGRYTYEVTGSDVVTPEAVDIVTQRPGHTVTLFACHPPGSAAFRYVVFGRLVSAPRPGR